MKSNRKKINKKTSLESKEVFKKSDDTVDYFTTTNFAVVLISPALKLTK